MPMADPPPPPDAVTVDHLYPLEAVLSTVRTWSFEPGCNIINVDPAPTKISPLV